ncbi:hypothetical protein DFP72DRAFT_933203 [Ephemerocybe angulata]|uniref:Uncharacterized protein n=1 Tax=Ephemerocybe angulata TaxID=980116 RepID=A0A8H6HAH8_9AGAR|nr:hypothetical protein DFP72DRAFT_933203 [Tulosesus angulatus]
MYKVEERGSGPSGYAPVDPFKASVSLGIRKILGRTKDRTIDEVPVAPPAPHPFQHQPWQRPPTKKDKKLEALEEEEAYYQRQQNYGRDSRHLPYPSPSSGRHLHPAKRAKEDEYEEQEAYPDTQKWLRGTPTFTSPPESPWSTVEHLQPSGVYDGVPPPLNLERVAEPRRLSRITERTEDSERASPSLSSRSFRTPSPRDRQDYSPTAPYRFIHPTSGVQHDVAPLSNLNSQDAVSVRRDSEGVPQSSGPAGTEPPKYVGHLWYLNVHAESLPYRWERCQASLYSDRLLLTWTSWGADGKRETLDWTMSLSSCRVISSNPKPAHPGAPEDIGIIAAGEQEAVEINGGKVDLAEYLVPFQLVWPGDTERLAAESLNGRSEWVSRIWDVMNGRDPVGNELQTSSPVTSFCYDLSAPPPDRPAAHHRRSSSLSARPVAESQKRWKRWADTMFSTEASNKEPFIATTEDGQSESSRPEYVDIEETMLAIAMSLFLDVIPRQLYLYFLLHFPALYFSRVTRIFHDANLGMSEIKKMALDAVESGGVANKMLVYNGIFPQEDNDAPAEYVNLRTSWYSFVDSLMREWKTLNIISVLLLSAILTILQIDVAAANPLTRYTALTSLLCAFMSLIYGCIYIIRFGTMRKAYKAAEWANESERSATSIFWNVWVMLAMPAVWLGWSMIFFIVCIMSFIWQTGPTVSPSTDPPIYLPSDPQILIPRIILSLLLGLGFLYLILIAVTFRKYGDPMEEAWRERIRGWMQERADRANPFSRQDYSTSKDNLREKVYDLKGAREDAWTDAFASQGRPAHPTSRWESKYVPKVDPGSFTDLPELERPDNPTNDGFPPTSASVPVPVPIPRSGFPTPAGPVTRPVGGGVNALAPFTNFMSANLPNLPPLFTSARGDRKKEMKEKKLSMANAPASSPLFTSFSPRHTSSLPIPPLAPLPTESMTVNDGYPIVPGVVAIPLKGWAPPDDSTKPQVLNEIEDMKEIIRLDFEGLHVRGRPAAEGIPMPEDLLEAGLQAQSWPLLCEDINRDWGTMVLSRPNSLRDLLKSLKKWNSELTAHNMFLLLVQLDFETLPPQPSSRSPEVLMSSVVQKGCAVYLGSSESKNARVRRGSSEDEVIGTAGDGDNELYKPMWCYALIEPPVEAVALKGNGGTGLSEDANNEGVQVR